MTPPVPPPSRLEVPWVTLSLIAANLVLAAVSAVAPGAAEGLSFDPAHPRLDSALMSMFLHANFVHLLGNLVFLAAVGPWVESFAGRGRLVVLYIAGGLAGEGAHLIVSHMVESRVPLM